MTPLPAVAAIAPEAVGPGLGGFLAVFVLALATVLLIRSMVGHLRKVRYGPGPGDEDTAALQSQGDADGAEEAAAAPAPREDG